MNDQESAAYGYDAYAHPSIPADLVIFAIRTKPASSTRRMLPDRTLEILLVRRGRPPYQGCWALPGGFSRPGETIEEAARRELASETGLSDVYLECLRLYDDPSRDPRGWIVAAAFFALVKGNPPPLTAADDAADAQWFAVEAVLQWPQGAADGQAAEVITLAFDHRSIIHDALAALRHKLHRTLVAQELLPQTFTLAELFQIIQVIDPEFSEERPNFMRKLLQRHILEETGGTDDRYSQRPARQYRFTGYLPPQSIYQ